MNRRSFLKYAGAAAAGGLLVGFGNWLELRQKQPTFTTSTSTTTSASTSTITSTTTTTESAVMASLRTAAEQDGLLVGAAASPEGLSDDRYRLTLSREFDFLTPANAMKWEPIDRLGFEPADNLVDFASVHEMKVKGHTLVWHQALPAWINEQMSSAKLHQAVQDHIRSVVGHFKGSVYAWDVVNEAMDDDGQLRNDIFLQKLGNGYISEAFQLAHETDPDALLFYNDYGAEGMNVKADAVYALVKELLQQGVPIDGVGLQMHLAASNYPDPKSIVTNIRRLVALGLKVNISEMDVRIRNLPGQLKDRLQVQRQVYHDVISACDQEPGFIAVTFWGFTDADSWIVGDEPFLFDENYQPKPAYWGVMQALLGG